MSLWSMLFGGKKPATNKATTPRQAKTSREVAIGLRPPPAPPAEDLPRIRWRDGSYPLQAVGETFYSAALEEICGPYTATGTKEIHEATLRREPDNAHDRNAVAVYILGRKVGHLPRDQAARVGQQMKAEGLMAVRCGAMIDGGRIYGPDPEDCMSYAVAVAVPTWGEIDFGTGPEPKPIHRKPSDRPEAVSGGILDAFSVAVFNDGPGMPVADELAALGASIAAGPGKTTSFLVVVAERPFSEGLTRSRTYRKAEELVAAGAPMRIWSIGEMRQFVKDCTP